MAKLKYTKNELKAQRDSLARFERYLPTLQLKKQQLQMEVRQLEARLSEKVSALRQLEDDLLKWVKLFAEPFAFEEHLQVQEVRCTLGNIAGVAIPVLQDIVFQRKTPDLFATPPWVDDGLQALEKFIRLRVERWVLEEQLRRLHQELRVTSQRVNLFEKVKIPETRNNIRVIRIFLGDQQTAGVARAKIAKGKSKELMQSA